MKALLLSKFSMLHIIFYSKMHFINCIVNYYILILQSRSDDAVSVLEQCVISIYDVDITDHKQCDPNDLYW